VPEWLAPHFDAAFGAEWVAEGEALAGRPPLDLRVNTLRAERDKVGRQLARLGAEPTRLSPVGLRIAPVDGPRRHPNVQAEEAFQRGRIEVQDEGSQLCALLAGAQAGGQVLDYCAGAGGKTLALAATMGNRGQVFAFDNDRNRLAPIYERLKRAGVRNVQVRSPGRGVLDDLCRAHGPGAGRRALHGNGNSGGAGRIPSGDLRGFACQPHGRAGQSAGRSGGFRAAGRCLGLRNLLAAAFGER
jgi:16S rRNA (cytosine967-C5)-methyltransferase